MKKECEIKLEGGIIITAGKTPYAILVSCGNKTMIMTRTLLETMLAKDKGDGSINIRIIGLLLNEE